MIRAAADDLERTAERFGDYIKLERACSENTRRAYLSDLSIWTAWCRRNSRDPLDVQADAVSRFLLEAQIEGRKKSSIQRLGAVLRSFAKFLQYDGQTDKVPRLAPLPSREEKLPEILNENEIQRIINACEDGTALGKRDRAYIELAYGAGMRASELCGLRLRDPDGHLVEVAEAMQTVVRRFLDSGLTPDETACRMGVEKAYLARYLPQPKEET